MDIDIDNVKFTDHKTETQYKVEITDELFSLPNEHNGLVWRVHLDRPLLSLKKIK